MLNKVLLIDDSVTIHRVIDLSIDLERLSLTKVFNKKDAEEKLQSDKFDYILLDNKLDEIQVNSFVKELKSKYPSTKLILLVGAFDKFSEQDLVNTGADDFLVKPFDSETLNLKLSDRTEIAEDIPTPIYFPEDDEEDNIDTAEDIDSIENVDDIGDVKNIDDVENIDNIDNITDTLDTDNLDLLGDDLISHKDIADIDDLDFSAVDDEFSTGDDIDLLDIETDLLNDTPEDLGTDLDIDTGLDVDINTGTAFDTGTGIDTDLTINDDELDPIDHLMGDLNNDITDNDITDNDIIGTDETLDNDNSNTSYANISDDAFKDIDLLLGDFDENFGIKEDNIDVEKNDDLLSDQVDTGSVDAVNSDELMDRVAFISEDNDIITDEQTGIDIGSDDPILDDINDELEHIDDLDIDTLSAISEIEKDINDVVIDSDDNINSDSPFEPKDTGIDFSLSDIDVSAVPVERSINLNVADIEDISDLHTESGMDIKDTAINIADVDIADMNVTDVDIADIEDLSDLHTELEPDLHTEPDLDIESDLHTESKVDDIGNDISSTLYDEVIVPTLNEYEKRFDAIQSKNAKKKTYEDTLLDTEEISFIDDKNQSESSADINFNISKDEIYSILANSLSKKFLQESIKDILSDHIKELVRDVIPTIAEKYIKEEIERLKSDV